MISVTRLRLTYIVADFLASSVAWCIFNVLRYYTLPYNYNAMSIAVYFSLPMVQLGQIIFPLMMVALFAVSGYYNSVFFKSRIDEFLNTFGVSLLGSIIIFFVALYDDNIEDRLKNYEMFTILWLLISVFISVPRLFITRNVIQQIRSRKIFFNALILGTSAKARDLANHLINRYPKMGFNVVGFIDRANCSSEQSIDGLPVVRFDDIESATKALKVDAFIIAHDNDDVHATVGIINRLFPLGKSIYITPDILHFITTRPRTRMVSGEVLIDVSKSEIPNSTLNLKRVSDVVISAIALVLLSPLFAVIACWVKTTSKGPVIYKQQRVGLNKKLFNIYKFRSMYVDSETNGPALSSADDPRITKAGHFLRKYRLDELPQFWNVLKGDMSLVGPRPEREFYLNQIIERAPYFSLLQQVRPGITSWGMVKYGYASSVDEMVERAKYDLLYVDNVSLIVDMKILFYTIETVFTGKGV